MALTTMDQKTRDRIKQKIERAYRNVERLPEDSNRRRYWWRIAQKLQNKLHGGPLRIMLSVGPEQNVFSHLDQLQDQLARELAIPRRYFLGMDLASLPDRTFIMRHIEGRFVLARELTQNPPY